jgi:hypothetical protein
MHAAKGCGSWLLPITESTAILIGNGASSESGAANNPRRNVSTTFHR